MHIKPIFLVAGVLSALLGAACAGDAARRAPAAPPETYREPHRPQFHFSPPAHWMNDPNGMVYYAGEYHLFYQYYPDSTVWGPMHWGHAVSKDLTHWEHLPIALYPDSLGYIFSGSAVVDWKNTSGFGKNGQPPLVAIFTYHNMAGEKAGRSDFQYQGIAYSLDNGRRWTKYAGNPVVPNPGNIRDFRDPKVIWHEASDQWIMVFAVADHVTFYGSKDLKRWTHLSDFGQDAGAHTGVWECPDLFPMPVEDRGDTLWTLLCSINPGAPNGGSGTQYFIGHFDGKKFSLDADFAKNVQGGKAVWLDYGRDNYAGVTWSDVPPADGRRLFLGWMSNWDYAQVVPTTRWRSAMTLPRELNLRQTAAGYRLFSRPARELNRLRDRTIALKPAVFSDQYDISAQIGAFDGLLEVELELESADGAPLDVALECANALGNRYEVGCNTKTGQYYADRRQAGKQAFSEKFAGTVATAPRISGDKTVRLRFFLDTASAELFADVGSAVMTDIFFPESPFTTVRMVAKKGKVRLIAAKAHVLKRIW